MLYLCLLIFQTTTMHKYSLVLLLGCLTLFSCARGVVSCAATDATSTDIATTINTDQAPLQPEVQPIAEPAPQPAPLVCGDERMDYYVPYLRNKRVALVANHTSVVGGVHLCDTLRKRGVDVVAVFSPEHGFRGTADAGEKVENEADANLRIISLYGNNKKPTPEQMKGIDVVLYDLQDVGVRFYTYISTMHYVMEACAEADIPFVVLDRPNPHGSVVDGPVREADKRSFVGMHQIPVVYGLTCGELACMINAEGWLEGGRRCDLKVVEMRGYDPHVRHSLGVSPSPNLRSPRAIWLYPSLCLFEGTKVSVGRGTDRPFTMVGAPIDGLGSHTFTPEPNTGAKDPMYRGQQCYGLDLDTVCLQGFDISLLLQMHRQMGDDRFWLNEKFFDLLAGNSTLRQQMKQGLSADSIRHTWRKGLERYEQMRQKYLIYTGADSTIIDSHTAEPIVWREAMYSPWVDTLMSRLTTDEKIAQLIWVTLNAYAPQKEIDKVTRACAEQGCGGVLIMQNTVEKAQSIIADIQSRSRVPVLFAIDGENGIARKLAGASGFPMNISLGAVRDTTLITRAGRVMAEQMKAVGFDVNFAPVADVNTNPLNPVIGTRAFGSDAQMVADLSVALSLGLQSGGCMAVLKHFPGHGDTSTDSHKVLSVVKNSRERITSVDLLPYTKGIARGVMGIMSAHIRVPELDAEAKAASISRKMLTDLLRDTMGFEGLVVTDAMNMLGIKIAVGSQNAEAASLIAGNDVAEFSLDLAAAIKAVRCALDEGKMTNDELDQKVRRVLATKEWCGLNRQRQYFGEPRVLTNSIKTEMLIDSLWAASVTVLADPDSLLRKSDEGQYYAVGEWKDGLKQVGELQPKTFAQSVKAVGKPLWLFADDKSVDRCLQLLSALPADQPTIVAYAGNPYRLKKMGKLRPQTSLVVVYERTDGARRALLHFALKGEKATGRFPISLEYLSFDQGQTIDRHSDK